MALTKNEFLSQLSSRLGYLPYSEVKKSVDFYSEAIDDRMEDGLGEEEAVAAIGSLDEVISQIEQSLPLTTLVKQKVRDSKERSGNKTLWILLAICGSPVWLPLLFAFFVVFLSVYVVVWAVIVSLFAVLASLLIAGVITAAAAFILPYAVFPPRLMLFGTGLVCAGVALLLVPAMKQLAAGLIGLTKQFCRWVKGLFIAKKEGMS